MNRTYAILTLAAALSLGACASDNMAWHDTTYNPGKDANGNYTNSNMNNDANRATLPDNPQVPGNQKSAMGISLSDQDRLFVVTALSSGQYEVSAADKAQLHSSDQQIKDFAQHLSADHMKANSQLTNLASRKGLTAPVGLTGDQINQLSQLDKLSGADFDREFLSQQRKAHEDAVTLFQSAANSASDKDVRDWAGATLPTLQSHLDMVKGFSDNKNGNNGMSR